ncbi:MAG: DUF1240 domain-containing protein [Desulfatitalea sp.]|nr:DUF1240 domain-containing protein [Desulfatitalea sp.]
MFLGIDNQTDMVVFSSKHGFFIFAIIMPILHLVVIIEHFYSEFIQRHSKSMGYGFIVILFLMFVSAITISSVIKAKVENAGYVNCKELEWSGTYSVYYTYVRNQAICKKLAAEEEEKKRKAAIFTPPNATQY